MELDFLYLLCFAFTAGYIDSSVGGGGLIQLPAYLIFAPHLSVATALGSNKLSSFMGTVIATIRYLLSTKVAWNAVIPALISCMIFSFIGAKMVSDFNSEYLRILILILLVVVAIYTFIKKDFGLYHKPKLNKKETLILSIAVGSVLGFYDGFFGPGAGSFMILAYVMIFGFNFINASASAKIINCGTNLAALVYFMYGGHVDYALAIPVGACNMAGSWLGARMAVKRGSEVVRIFFLVIVSGLILKFTYDIFE